MIRIKGKREAQFGTWVSGSIDDGSGMLVDFEAKVFEEPSRFGIPTPRFEEGGNVSKLHLRAVDGRELYCWDRGLDYVDCDESFAEGTAREVVAFLEDGFCK